MGYNFIAPITIDNTKVADDHTNFPVCFQGTFDGTGGEPDLRTTGNGGNIQNTDATGGISGGYTVPADLKFVDASGTKLSHEIELYNATTGQITAWVKIATMDADADLTFYIVYGNSAVTASQEDINNVWTNYEAVYHCAEASGDLLDSTANGNTLADYGDPIYRASGKTGYAVTLDANDYFAVSSIGIDYHGQSDMQVMISCALGDNNADQYILYGNVSTGWYIMIDDVPAAGSQKATFKIDDGVDDDAGWGTTQGLYDSAYHTYHQAIDDSESDHLGFVDGSLEYDGANTDVDDMNDNFYIGHPTDGAVGDVCEVRAVDGYLGAAYLETEHNSFDPSTFLTVGAEAAPSFSYRSSIVIDNTKVADDHTNFPVCFQGTFDGTGGEPDLRDSANGGNVEHVDTTGTISGADDVPADLTFTSDAAGATELSFEIEKYDKTTGEITAWIKIPTMDSDADLTFYLFYGNALLTESREDISNVWTAYDAVYHMAEASGDLLDSTGNGQTLADAGNPTYRQTGLTGYAVSFDGVGDYFYKSDIGVNFSASGADTTLMVLMASDAITGTLDIFASSNINTGYYMAISFGVAERVRFKIDDGTDDDSGYINEDFSDGWHHVSQVIEGGVDHDGWMDGVTYHYEGAITSVGNLTDGLCLGRGYNDGAYDWAGDMCEVRASQEAKTQNWLTTEYNSFYPSTFLSVGSEMVVTGFIPKVIVIM